MSHPPEDSEIRFLDLYKLEGFVILARNVTPGEYPEFAWASALAGVIPTFAAMTRWNIWLAIGVQPSRHIPHGCSRDWLFILCHS